MKPANPANRNLILVHRLPDEDDKQETFKPLQLGLVARLFSYARPVRGKLIALIILTVIRSAQLPALVWIASRIITGPIAKGDLSKLTIAIFGYGVLAVVTDTMFHFRQRFALEIAETVVNEMRADIFRSMQRQQMSFFNRVKLGRIISRVTSDMEAIRIGIQDVGFVSAIQAGQMFFAAMVMLYADWELFLVIFAMAPLLWFVNNHFRMKFSRLSRSAAESFSRVTATLAESVNGIRVTQGFVRQETNAGLFRGLLADHSKYNIELARTAAVLSSPLELNSQFCIAFLLLFGGWRVFHGTLTVETLILVLLMANQFFSPITIIGTQYNQGLVAVASAERVFWLLDAKPDWEDDPEAGELPRPKLGSGGEGTGARVEFRNVSFSYDGSRTILHDVNFTAEPGQTVALVGHTGSGKSSIINLASKFYLPTKGEVVIDGVEIRRIASLSLHRQMGMVQQQNFLFTGTVFDNIRLSRPEATIEDVRRTAERLGCLDLFEAMPRGFYTAVGERGAGLSAGQRQVVCFARALLADPRIVILDEATSAIDALTEARLQTALGNLLRGRTSFVVAHRLSTIRTADLLLVLDQGRIIERGTHEQLVAQGGHYAALYRQFVQIDDGSAVG